MNPADLNPKLPTPAPVDGLVPIAGRLDAMVESFYELPPSQRAEFGGLPDAARAALLAAVNADPASAFADVPAAEMVRVAIDSYVAAIADLGRELERNLDATRAAAGLTHQQKADDEGTHLARAAARVAELVAARDQVLAAHESAASAVADAFEASLWAVSPESEQLARARLAETRALGAAAVRALFDGVASAPFQDAKLALLRLARAEVAAIEASMGKSDGHDHVELTAALRSLKPALVAFETAVKPAALDDAKATLVAVQRARRNAETIDKSAFRRADRGHGQ